MLHATQCRLWMIFAFALQISFCDSFQTSINPRQGFFSLKQKLKKFDNRVHVNDIYQRRLGSKGDDNDDVTMEEIDEELEAIISESEATIEEARLNVWKSRRRQIRNTLKEAEKLKYFRVKNGYYVDPEGEEEEDKNQSALATTAFVVAAGAVLLRVGGRATLVSTLGLDFVQDNPEMQAQMETVLGYVQGVDPATELLLFTLAWVLVKVLCFDAGSVVLAFSSGILFGGVLQGAVISAAAATLGSAVAFGLAKVDSPVRTKALEVLEEYPALRGIEKVVAKDGVKAILTLRLAPVLPIPIGLYNYVYGVTNVPLLDFVVGIFIGSLKPYFFDSYLGYFGKNLLEGKGSTETEDSLLLLVLGVSVLIGVFASQLAGETWETIQAEVEADKRAKIEEGELVDDGIVREAFGFEFPEFIVNFQSALKAADKRLKAVVEQEVDAQVWNYTQDDEIPKDINPSFSMMSPEVTGKNKGFNVGPTICEGLVLTPILFKTFDAFSDPLFNGTIFDADDLTSSTFPQNTESLPSQISINVGSGDDSIVGSSNSNDDKIPHVGAQQKALGAYVLEGNISFVFETLENMKVITKERLKEIQTKLNNMQ